MSHQACMMYLALYMFNLHVSLVEFDYRVNHDRVSRARQARKFMSTPVRSFVKNCITETDRSM